MTRVFLLSDTHSYIDERLIHFAEQADEIWHAGDIGSLNVSDTLESIGKLRAVHGNIDDHTQRSQYPRDLIFEVENQKIWMTHIGGYPGTYSARIRQGLETEQPDVFVCGHSHILKVQKDPKQGHLHLNPGAAGIHGFHHMRTALWLEMENGKIQELKVIEFGLRAKTETK